MGALGISMMLLGLGAQAYSSNKSADANNALRKKLLEKSDSLDAVFNKEYNMDYMQTPSVKNMMAAYATGLKDVNKNAEGRAVMAGASPEAVIAGKESTNQNYGDFLRKVASGQDAYRADKERMYNYRRDALDNQIFASDKDRASQWNNLMSNAAGLGTAAISAGSLPITGGGTGNWLKKLFKQPGAVFNNGASIKFN